MEEQKKKVGRPTIFKQELAKEICARLAKGVSLRTVCLADDMPEMGTIYDWIRLYPEFQHQYAQAKEDSTDAMAEEIMDIADNGTNDWMEIEKGKGVQILLDREHVERSKLRIDSRKWLLAKMKPKKYGDKIDMTTNGKDIPSPIYGGKSVS